MSSTRFAAQVEASRVNGARSHGPITGAGKMTCAANPVRHGLATRAALMPGESMEEYRANLDARTATLSPVSPGEAQVVAQVADLAFRQARLARLEERLAVAAVEKALAVSTQAETLRKVSEALEGMRGLLTLGPGPESAHPAVPGGGAGAWAPSR